MKLFADHIQNLAVAPEIAEGVYINGLVSCEAKLIIEKNVFTGYGVMILCGSYDYLKFGEDRKKSGKVGAITIREGVWIASGAIIIGPCEIGKNAVVAAGAVVTKDVPEYAVVAGVPARVIKMIPK